MAKETKDNVAGDQSYLNEMSGMGLENFDANSVSVAYLSMVQPGGQASVEHTPGTWRNSATNKNYGPSVKVIPLAFKTVWVERDKDTFMTVGRYEPRSIEVTTTYPKPGQRGFPKMTNPQSGNNVEELFMYAVLIADHLDDGVLYFSPTVSSMKACKQWNTLIKSARQADGTPGGMASFIWTLYLELVQNPAKPNNPNEKICKFTKVTNEGPTSKDLWQDTIKPQLVNARNIQLLAAPEASGDADTSTQG